MFPYHDKGTMYSFYTRTPQQGLMTNLKSIWIREYVFLSFWFRICISASTFISYDGDYGDNLRFRKILFCPDKLMPKLGGGGAGVQTLPYREGGGGGEIRNE